MLASRRLDLHSVLHPAHIIIVAPGPATILRASPSPPSPALVNGQRYYFVVLRDTILPLQRCVFTYQGE